MSGFLFIRPTDPCKCRDCGTHGESYEVIALDPQGRDEHVLGYDLCQTCANDMHHTLEGELMDTNLTTHLYDTISDLRTKLMAAKQSELQQWVRTQQLEAQIRGLGLNPVEVAR